MSFPTFKSGDSVQVLPLTFTRKETRHFNGKVGSVSGKMSMCGRLYEVVFNDGTPPCFVLPHNLTRIYQ